MERLTAMKITGLGLYNFRNHTEPEHFDFGDYSFITGHNGSGKTTMAHAVCYALYGITYYGEQKIERLMNESANEVSVQLEFTDQDGKAHTLIRSRKNDKNSLLLDGYTVRQTDIESMFCDHHTFLAMFNPTYLTERLSGTEGRTLLLKHMKTVSPQEVLSELGSFAKKLKNIDFTTTSPENLIDDYRAAIRRAGKQADVLQGNIEAVESALETSEKELADLFKEKCSTEDAIANLKAKQFEGIDLDELTIQRDMLISQLAENSGKENPKVTELKVKIEQVKQRTYISKYTQALADAQAEAKMLSEKYNKLAERIKALKPGTQCPTCMTKVTESNLAEVQNGMIAELKSLKEHGEGVIARGKEIAALDKQSLATFNQFKEDDLKKLTAELETLMQSTPQVSPETIRGQLSDLDDQTKYGNLSEGEFSELSCLEATLVGINAQIETIKKKTDESQLRAGYEQKAVFEQQIEEYKEMVNALTEYLFKRVELATKELAMPNVTLHLYDVYRTTGEVKSVFKFDYKGREYNTLSLSEKTLAGMEISAMMRRITGIDCPICIDNTESIAAFNNVDMPSQTLLLRFVKGQPLSVQFKNKMQVMPVQELRKAS